MTAKKYRHKGTHEIVEAIQFVGDYLFSMTEADDWVDSLFNRLGLDREAHESMKDRLLLTTPKGSWLYIHENGADIKNISDSLFKTHFEPLEEEEPPKTPIDILNDALTEVDAVMKKYDLIGLVNLADKHGNGACGEKVDASWTPFILEDDKSYAIQKDWETEDICILHKAFMRLYSLDFRNGRTIRRVMNALLPLLQTK